MNGIEHLTKNQLAGYRAGAFDALERREIGRHLLKCESCRRSLPAPTFDDFWKAVMNERETEETTSSRPAKLSLSPFIPSIYAFSLATLLLFLGAGLVYFIFFNKATTDLNGQLNTQEKTVETAKLENKSEIKTVAENNSANIQKTPASVEKKSPPQPAARKLTLSVAKNRNELVQAKTQNGSREIEIAAVRGNTNSSKQGQSDALDAKLVLSGASLKLTWSKYPQAIAYSVVVADAESNDLIEEIKTEDKTEVLIPLKKFDPSKKYEVKVAAVLPDGSLKTSKTFILTKNLRKH